MRVTRFLPSVCVSALHVTSFGCGIDFFCMLIYNIRKSFLPGLQT